MVTDSTSAARQRFFSRKFPELDNNMRRLVEDPAQVDKARVGLAERGELLRDSTLLGLEFLKSDLQLLGPFHHCCRVERTFLERDEIAVKGRFGLGNVYLNAFAFLLKGAELVWNVLECYQQRSFEERGVRVRLEYLADEHRLKRIGVDALVRALLPVSAAWLQDALVVAVHPMAPVRAHRRTRLRRRRT